MNLGRWRPVGGNQSSHKVSSVKVPLPLPHFAAQNSKLFCTNRRSYGVKRTVDVNVSSSCDGRDKQLKAIVTEA